MLYQSELKRISFFLIHLPYELLAMAFAMGSVMLMGGSAKTVGTVATMLLLLGFCCAWVRLHGLQPVSDPKAVDIWAYQQKLMEISNQSTPVLPVITKETLLYSALIAEELSETYGHLHTVLSNSYERARAIDPNWKEEDGASFVRTSLAAMGPSLHHYSLLMREELTTLPDDWRIALPYESAKALLDDVGDVAVVTAGFALATGLPAREGYKNVGDSNLSKANPETGVIDKKPDGKWIKGVNYVEPQLDAVLHQQLAANWHE